MKNKSMFIGIVMTLILLGIAFGLYMFIDSSQEPLEMVDCNTQKESFDAYVVRSRLPMIEDTQSLCHGLYMGSNFNELDPQWAVGELTGIEGRQLIFKGIEQSATTFMGVKEVEASDYKVGQHYKIDMNNICRDFFMMVDSRHPSSVRETYVQPVAISCQ